MHGKYIYGSPFGCRCSQMTAAALVSVMTIQLFLIKNLKTCWFFTVRILDWLLRFTKTCLKPASPERSPTLRWSWNGGGSRSWRRGCKSFGAPTGGLIQVQARVLLAGTCLCAWCLQKSQGRATWPASHTVPHVDLGQHRFALVEELVHTGAVVVTEFSPVWLFFFI